MRRRIEDHHTCHIEIPHAVDASKKTRRVVEAHMFVAEMPRRIIHIVDNKKRNGQRRAKQCAHQQELETVNDRFIEGPSHPVHRGQVGLFAVKVVKHFAHQIGE